MAFDFGLLQPYVDNSNIVDIDANGLCVFVNDQKKGKYKVLDLEPNYLKEMLLRLCNYPQIDKEFNFNSPILDGTMDGLRIHAVHESAMTKGLYWFSIRKNPIELKVKEKDYKKIFELLVIANRLKWSYAFGGERGSGKTQWVRSCIAKFNQNQSVAIIAENDEMHMNEILPDRLISQYIVNSVLTYEKCTSSVLRDNSDYVIFQEVRDHAIDDLFSILSSSSRVLTTLHVKNALLMPQRMIQLSRQKNDHHLLSTIHDYVQMCIVPIATIQSDGQIKRYIKEIALFWNDEHNQPQKQLIYENDGKRPIYHDIPSYFIKEFEKNDLSLEWKED